MPGRLDRRYLGVLDMDGVEMHSWQMIARAFTVDYDEGDDEVRLTLTGELDRMVAEKFSRALRDAELSDAPRIVVDAAELTFMDSAGLALLLQAARRAGSAGRRLHVANPSHPIRRLLEIAAMGHLIAPD